MTSAENAQDDPTGIGRDGGADAVAEDDTGRVTVVGAPETIDRATHPASVVAAVAGILVVVVVALVGLAGMIGTDDSDARLVPEVVVPRVTGRGMAEAQAQLEQLGLIVDVRYEPNEIVPIDVVVEQEPIAGARLEVGEQVVLSVSDGPAGIRVPEFGEVTAGEAVRLLTSLGLVGVVEEVHDESVPQGQIVGTIPAEGTRVVAGDQVTVQLSAGPEPRTVPGVVGQPSAAAFNAIGRAELQVGDVTRRVVADAAPGTVLSTDPAGGEQAPRGYPVSVVVAAAPGSTQVPDVVGFTTASARRVASEADLGVTVRTQTLQPGDRRDGRVLWQSPVAGSPASADGTITITVGAIPVPTTTTTTTVPGATSSTTSTTAPRR
ncbi:MAG: PASTA domain-containing protein [Microthrixaceae bacterium]